MSKHIRTFITDREWQHECRKRLDAALALPELAKKALQAMDENPKLKREIPKPLFFKVWACAH